MPCGFQLIHAFLSFEGVPRKWCNPSFGEPDADLLNWRLKGEAPSDEDFDDSNLAI